MTTTPEARPEWEPVGYFSELKSAMTYRLWEQGGHEQQGDEVPLYSPAVHTEMFRAQESERVLREALSFYADPKRYHGANQMLDAPDRWTPAGSVYQQDVTRDNGGIARAALKGAP